MNNYTNTCFRKCGVVVCNACSMQRFLLPAQSSKPLRVCNKCYDELAKSSNNADFSSRGKFYFFSLNNFYFKTNQKNSIMIYA